MSPVIAAVALAASAAGGVAFPHAEGGAVIVPTFVNGHGPHPFRLDTGAAGTAIAAALAAELGLAAVERTVVVTPVGEETRVVAAVGRIAVGSAEAAALRATVVPGDFLGGAAGILGQDFLSRFDYTIDYRHRRLTWSAGGAGGVRVPLHAAGGLFLVDLEQRGRAARLVADTGSGALVLFDGARLRSEAAGPPAEIASASGRRRRVEMRHVRGLTLGPLALRDQTAAIVPRDDGGGGDGLLPLHQFASVAFANRDGYLVIRPR
jgi:gag-polyprotein putative aspartyl protease